MEQKCHGWVCTAAMAAEGCVCLAGMLPRLAALWLWQLAAGQTGMLLSAAQLSAIGAFLLAGLLNGPLRLGRFGWYAALTACRPGSWPGIAAFAAGSRRLMAAVGWRFGLWWRRTVALAVAALPPLCLLQAGGKQPADGAFFWLCGALLLALLTGGAALLWLCRYAAAPVFLLEGCSGGEALRRSARLMRGHLREYLNFLGDRAAALLPCLLLVPLVWLLPRFRCAHTALLLRWRQERRAAGLAI